MIVCGQQFSTETIARIQATIDAEPELSRTALSRRVCRWLEWRRKNGQWKEMSCRVALLKLHRQGAIGLGSHTHARPGGGTKRRVLPDVVISSEPIFSDLRALGRVEVVAVGSSESKAAGVWQALMERHHYLGSGPLCGAQIRYLVKNERGQWLGALAFSAAAWRVAARDRWIGWSERARQEHLEQVINNSRFLILPWVRVPHLASHVLALSIRRVGRDWQERYGVAPVLVESFVTQERFSGTSYRAANWRHVGQTQGRGRQDRERKAAVGVKDVYLYPLHSRTREVLCQTAPEPKKVRPLPQGADWAQEELGAARLNDERLRQRLLILARDMYDRPQASIPQACQSRAKTKAAYRFFEHAETSMDKILESHYEATFRRMREESVVLVAQDTTSLNYSAHPATEGLGPIGTKQEGVVGLIVHDSVAFNLAGTPLGLVDVQCWARDPKDFGKKHQRYQLPIEEKESQKWFTGFRKAGIAKTHCPNTTVVSVADREADIYELFEEALTDGAGAELLVRATRDRLLADEQGHLWEKIAEQPVAGIQPIDVPRRSAQRAREARLELRFAGVTLKPPKRKPQLGPLSVWAIAAEEVDAPEGVKPLKWLLLTTLAIHDFNDAAEKLRWYARRWGIEVYHRTLKSGCKVEERQLGSADRIETCLAIDMVVAWRVFHLTKLGRETPDVPCTVFFEDAEWKALYSFIRQNPALPEQPPTLREAVRMVASLGGFLGRKGDGEPGTQSLWIGLQRLDDITAMWKYMAQTYVPHLLKPPVSSKPDYG